MACGRVRERKKPRDSRGFVKSQFKSRHRRSVGQRSNIGSAAVYCRDLPLRSSRHVYVDKPLDRRSEPKMERRVMPLIPCRYSFLK